MALYIILNSGKEVQWHVGETLRVMNTENLVTEIQADGDELEYLKQNFENLPYSRLARAQNWYGDMAKFIANAIPSTMVTFGQFGRGSRRR